MPTSVFTTLWSGRLTSSVIGGRPNDEIRVNRPLRTGREPIGVRPLLIQRGDAGWLAGAIERNPVEVALRRVVGRRHEVTQPGLLVDAHHADHVKVTAGEPAGRTAFPGADDFEPPPAVAIGRPGEGAAAIEELEVVLDVDPGLVLVGENRSAAPRSRHRQG